MCRVGMRERAVKTAPRGIPPRSPSTQADICRPCARLLCIERMIGGGNGKILDAQQRMARMRYLVTGGAGFFGSQLAEDLARMGHEVVIVDRVRDEDLARRFPCEQVDLRDPAGVDR